MNLFTQNNLLDVSDILESQRALQLKDCATQDADSVSFTSGNVVTDHFHLNAFDARQNVYLRCDSNGAFYVDATSNIQPWVRTRTQNIPLSLFNNDVGAVYWTETKPIAFTADYFDLYNRPTLQGMLLEEFGYDPLCKAGSNLSDLSGRIRDSPYLDLGLNRYATCNYMSKMVFDRMEVGSLTLAYAEGQEGIVTADGSVVESTTATGAKATEDVFGLVRLQHEVATATHLRSVYSNVVHKVEDKIQFYQSNVTAVDENLKENLNEYVISESNLSDVDGDVVSEYLSLRKFRDEVDLSSNTINVGDMSMLFIPNVYNLYVDAMKEPLLNKLPYLKNRPFKYAFLYKPREDDVDFQDPEGFPLATPSTIGIVRSKRNINNVFEDGATPKMSYIHERNIVNLEAMRNSLNTIDLYRVLDTMYEENLIENTRLLRFSCNLEEMSNISPSDRMRCYSNLQLASVVHTKDYVDLLRKPTSVSCFDNDMGYVSRWNNLNEYVMMRANECLSSLGVGNLSKMDTDSFDISGGVAELDFARVYSRLTLRRMASDLLSNLRFIENDLMYLGCESRGGDCEWRGLPEGSGTTAGVIRLHDTLQYDEEGGFAPSVLSEVYTELHEDMRKVLRTIRETREMLATN